MEVNGKLKGLSIEVFDALVKHLDTKISLNDVKLRPWAFGYKVTLKKKNTMLFSTTRTKQREKLFKWVGPIVVTKVGLMAPKNRNISIKNKASLNNYKIGAVINDIGEQLLLSAGVKKSNIKSTSGKTPVITNFRKMGKGSIDMFAYNINVAMYGAKSYQINSNDFEVVHILKEGKLYFAFNKNTSDKIIIKWQKALDKIKADGTYDKILKKYK
jgi:polar amino acid transport system substrate-binding protein